MNKIYIISSLKYVVYMQVNNTLVPSSQFSSNTQALSLETSSAQRATSYSRLPLDLVWEVASFVLGNGWGYTESRNKDNLSIFQVNRDWRKMHLQYLKK